MNISRRPTTPPVTTTKHIDYGTTTRMASPTSVIAVDKFRPSTKKLLETASSQQFVPKLRGGGDCAAGGITTKNEKETRNTNLNNTKKKKSKYHQTFFEKLYDMLEYSHEGNLEHIVSWEMDGTGIKVHDPKTFEECIMPIFFTLMRIKSFQRELLKNGFQRITSGDYKHCYVHKQFQRREFQQEQQQMHDLKQDDSGTPSSSDSMDDDRRPSTSARLNGSSCVDGKGVGGVVGEDDSPRSQEDGGLRGEKDEDDNVFDYGNDDDTSIHLLMNYRLFEEDDNNSRKGVMDEKLKNDGDHKAYHVQQSPIILLGESCCCSSSFCSKDEDDPFERMLDLIHDPSIPS